jgi:hypothetical protein
MSQYLCKRNFRHTVLIQAFFRKDEIEPKTVRPH